jgi:hypothetical protein
MKTKHAIETIETVPVNLLFVTNEKCDATVGLCPGAHLPTQNRVDHFATVINEKFSGSVENILAAARYCAEANDKLDVLQLQQLHRRLQITRPTFSKLASIGRNDALHSRKVLKRLPPNWTIIHQLRDCNTEDLNRMICEKVLTPGCSRASVINWIKENTDHRKAVRNRAAHDDSGDDELLRELSEALSPEFIAIWHESPASVRTRFAKNLTNNPALRQVSSTAGVQRG